MKKLFLATIFLIISFIGFSQITLENTYTLPKAYEFGTTKFSPSDTKYYYLDEALNQLKIYNLNHSLYQTINIPVQTGASSYEIYYPTTNLFDSDAGIEYILEGYRSSGVTSYIIVYNEDGSELLNIDGFETHWEFQTIACIKTTETGTKLVLDKYDDTEVKVYSLPGNLISALINKTEDNGLLNAYPNPTINLTKIEYKLPSNLQEATLNIFDTKGNKIKTYIVDSNFDHLLLETSEFKTGVYLYRLETTNWTSESKKLVIN